MTKFKTTIEYFGKGLVGWQAQDVGVSVQGILQEALFKLSQEKPEIIASGRTDAGVHALGQVVHFDLEKNFTAYNVQQGLNSYLHETPVSVVSAEIVDENFHARFSALKRYYRYIILNRKTPSALERDRAWHVPKMLDIEVMREAAKYLIGQHDFTSFRASECQSKNPVKTLDSVDIYYHNHDKFQTPSCDGVTSKVYSSDENNLNSESCRRMTASEMMDAGFHQHDKIAGSFIHIDVSARSFLHHQVRNIVGTLKQVGEGKTKPEEIKDILEAKNRSAAGETAPAHGLYFMKVEY